MGNNLVKCGIDNVLQHYGVLGMKWGVITKEKFVSPFLSNAMKQNEYKRYKFNDKLTKLYGKRWLSFPDPYKGLINSRYSIAEKSIRDVAFEKYWSKVEGFIKKNNAVSSFDELNTISGKVSMENQANTELANDLTKKTLDILTLLNKKEQSGVTSLSKEQLRILMEYSTNCTNCAATYELRRRGYDVEAMPYSEGITKCNGLLTDYSDNFKSGFKWIKPNISKTDSYVTKLSTAILKSSSGDQRGYVTISGHVFNYEVQNKKVTYIDVQFGGLNSKITLDALKKSDPEDIKFARTDNLELDISILTRVRNRDFS